MFDALFLHEKEWGGHDVSMVWYAARLIWGWGTRFGVLKNN
jgi:hypothetical protein